MWARFLRTRVTTYKATKPPGAKNGNRTRHRLENYFVPTNTVANARSRPRIAARFSVATFSPRLRQVAPQIRYCRTPFAETCGLRRRVGAQKAPACDYPCSLSLPHRKQHMSRQP